jgi:hypothetical protein
LDNFRNCSDCFRIYSFVLGRDGLLFDVTDGEADTDFSKRAGIGEGWADTVHGLFGGDHGTSFFDVVGGPVGSAVVSPIWDTLQAFRNHHQREMGVAQSLSENALTALKGSISSWSMASKAWYMYNYNMVLNRKDLTPIARSNKLEAVALLIGMPPAKEGEYYDMMSAITGERQAIRDAAQVVKHHRMQFLLAHEDPEKQEQIGREIEAFMSGIDNPDTRRKIIQQVNRSRSEFKYDEAMKDFRKQFNRNYKPIVKESE